MTVTSPVCGFRFTADTSPYPDAVPVSSDSNPGISGLGLRRQEHGGIALAACGTTGSTSRAPWAPPIASVVVMGCGVGQNMGHCALVSANRMRCPLGNTHEVKCISMSSANGLAGLTSGEGVRADSRWVAVEARAGHLRDAAIGRHVREPREPVGARRVGRTVSSACGRPRISRSLVERRADS